MIGGRGCGKTRGGAEWVDALARGDPAFTGEAVGRIALVGETLHDVRDVMIEGESGLLNLPRRGRRGPSGSEPPPAGLGNGAVAQAFSAEEADSLRGPQFGAAWCDEIAKWREAEAAFDMLQFGLRLGARPRSLVTTDAPAGAADPAAARDPRTVVTRARTHDNAENLAPISSRRWSGRYAGTRLGRQELDGELIADRPDALWTREGIEAARVAAAPDLSRIVVAVDPPASSGGALGCLRDRRRGRQGERAFVLADASLRRARPRGWAAAALALYHRQGPTPSWWR